jgi:hypothetical protein
MKVYITQETSGLMSTIERSSLVASIADSLKVLETKFYGNDLQELYVALFCMEDKYLRFFNLRKPTYRKEAKTYIHRGVQCYTGPGTFIYEMRLDYNKYSLLTDIRECLIADLLLSFNEIKKCSKIKDFQFDEFINDVTIILTDASVI